MKKNKDLQLYQLFQDKYHGKWNKEYLKDVQRLKNGEPLDYIIGWAPFIHCKLDLRYKPLIPRPETEYWTEAVIKEITAGKWQMTNRKSPKTIKVLDIFSGAGCSGIAVLKDTKAKVDLSELDPRLIKQIKISLKLNKISPKRYKVIQSNIFNNVRGKLARHSLGKGGYDFILANPPYISTKTKVHPLVLKHEPQLALFGGKKGLDIIKKFLDQAPKYLRSNPSANSGQVWMEFSPEQKPLIDKILKANNNYKTWQFNKDQYNRWRFVQIYLHSQKFCVKIKK